MQFKLIIVAILFFGLQMTADADSVSTPGTIASLLQIPGTQFQYLPVTDLSVLTKAQQTQFTLSVLPATEPSFALQQRLSAIDSQQYLGQIKSEKIAGFSAASVHVKQQSSDWWMVIKLPGLNLFIRVQDIQDALAHRADVERLVKSVKFAPAVYPQLVSGHFTMSSSYSDSYGSDLSAFTESSISLQPDGVFSTQGFAGVSGANVSGYSQGGSERGRWQVRGNRILAFEPPDTFYNYRFEAFTNGLEVYDDSNEQHLWVRK